MKTKFVVFEDAKHGIFHNHLEKIKEKKKYISYENVPSGQIQYMKAHINLHIHTVCSGP